MKALLVFHEHGNHIFDRLLQKGYKHCFAAVCSGDYWVRLDSQAGRPAVEVVAGADFDLATFYRGEGFMVVETEQGGGTWAPWPLMVANCVGFSKAVLCIRAPWVLTPYQLYRHMTRGQLLPGKSLFSPPRPQALPPILMANPQIAPATVPPERTDPRVLEAGKKQREAELRRRGRSATVLTGGKGVTEKAPLGRPTATSGDLGA